MNQYLYKVKIIKIEAGKNRKSIFEMNFFASQINKAGVGVFKDAMEEIKKDITINNVK